MPNQLGSTIDKLFPLVAFLVMAFVALKPSGFIRAITFGRSSRADVSGRMLRITQIIAGLAALSIAVSFIPALFKEFR
jgi:hypothetical protein